MGRILQIGGWNLKDYDNHDRTTAVEKITSSNGLHHLLYQKIRRCCNLSQPNRQCLVSNVARQHKKHLLTFEYYCFVPTGFPDSWPLLWRRRSVILSQSNLCPVPEKKKYNDKENLFDVGNLCRVFSSEYVRSKWGFLFFECQLPMLKKTA